MTEDKIEIIHEIERMHDKMFYVAKERAENAIPNTMFNIEMQVFVTVKKFILIYRETQWDNLQEMLQNTKFVYNMVVGNG